MISLSKAQTFHLSTFMHVKISFGKREWLVYSEHEFTGANPSIESCNDNLPGIVFVIFCDLVLCYSFKFPVSTALDTHFEHVYLLHLVT